MTGAEFSKLMVLLDSLWGGVDEVREAGYRFLLEEFPYELGEQAVTELARGKGRALEDLKWLPRASEVYARCHQIVAENELFARGLANAERLALEETNPPTQEDHNGNREGADLPAAG